MAEKIGTEVVQEARQQARAEADRWAALTPEQQAAERRKEEQQRKARKERAAEVVVNGVAWADFLAWLRAYLTARAADIGEKAQAQVQGRRPDGVAFTTFRGVEIAVRDLTTGVEVTLTPAGDDDPELDIAEFRAALPWRGHTMGVVFRPVSAAELPLALDVLDAQLHEFLTDRERFFRLKIEREAPAAGRVMYRLQQVELGALGDIRLRSLGSDRVEFAYLDPPRPGPAEGSAGDRDALYTRRKRFHDLLLTGFWDQLARSGVWRATDARRPAWLGGPAEHIEAEEQAGGGATDLIQIRAEVFKRLKDERPSRRQNEVAMLAQGELGERLTAESVRYAYRKMGWAWERANRIR